MKHHPALVLEYLRLRNYTMSLHGGGEYSPLDFLAAQGELETMNAEAVVLVMRQLNIDVLKKNAQSMVNNTQGAVNIASILKAYEEVEVDAQNLSKDAHSAYMQDYQSVQAKARKRSPEENANFQAANYWENKKPNTESMDPKTRAESFWGTNS